MKILLSMTIYSSSMARSVITSNGQPQVGISSGEADRTPPRLDYRNSEAMSKSVHKNFSPNLWVVNSRESTLKTLGSPHATHLRP